MKLKSYFLLSIVVGMTFACSSDENVPEVEVFGCCCRWEKLD